MKVEIWSDVVCPWCYVGKRRFEAALERFEHADEVEVVWKSFELDPNAPGRRGTTNEHLASKYGITLEQAARKHEEMTRIAATEGLEFHMSESKGGNTLDAHRLLHLAREHGLQSELKERLMCAYFTEGEPIGDREALARLAAEVGVPDAGEMLESDRFVDEVREDELEAQEFGIDAVPVFVIDRRYGVEGAQPAEAILEVLEQAWAERATVS
jgi:predicted DsbA family dithiol-disulfide isomerase